MPDCRTRDDDEPYRESVSFRLFYFGLLGGTALVCFGLGFLTAWAL